LTNHSTERTREPERALAAPKTDPYAAMRRHYYREATDLPRVHRVVGLLGTYADPNGVAFPQQARLAAELAASRHYVREGLGEAEKRGLIVPMRRRDPRTGRWRATSYLVLAVLDRGGIQAQNPPWTMATTEHGTRQEHPSIEHPIEESPTVSEGARPIPARTRSTSTSSTVASGPPWVSLADLSVLRPMVRHWFLIECNRLWARGADDLPRHLPAVVQELANRNLPATSETVFIGLVNARRANGDSYEIEKATRTEEINAFARSPMGQDLLGRIGLADEELEEGAA
jgi:hypothetical protein